MRNSFAANGREEGPPSKGDWIESHYPGQPELSGKALTDSPEIRSRRLAESRTLHPGPLVAAAVAPSSLGSREATPMAGDSTNQLQDLISRMQAGDPGAREELLGRAYDRLTALARKMLRSFPRVRSFEDSGDVLHDALPRLLRALQAAPPASPADFFRLAARQIKWELQDLVERYYGPKGPGGKHAPQAADDTTNSAPALGDKSDATHEPARLALWREFHAQVDALPETEREVFDLVWYQGLTQAEAAQVLGVAEVTVRRRWMAARLCLQDHLREQGLG
jgi:RNA polymerase sigma-70 factor (ECF subfamily)